MKVSKETAARHREALLAAASRLFREKGFDKVGIAEIAAAADLTHGAFYTHFASKEELCTEAFAQTANRTAQAIEATGGWRGYVEAYLSPKHVRNRGNGCALAALGGDVPREGRDLLAAYSDGAQRAIDALAAAMAREPGGATREQAIVATAAMVGALILARGTTDTALRDEILDTVKRKLLDRPSAG